MTTAAQLRSQLEKLVNDPAVAGISLTGTYDSLTGPTVTPPAGTIRQDGQVVGLFTMADGEVAATLDVWGSDGLAVRGTARRHLLWPSPGRPHRIPPGHLR